MPPAPPLRLARPALVAVLALALSACGSSAARTAGSASPSAAGPGSATPAGGPAPAAEELVVYSGRNKSLVDRLLQDFARTTGTRIFVRYGDSAELAAQLGEEGARTEADVFFSQDAGALGALSSAGRLQPLPGPLLDRVDARFRADDGSWVGTSARARVLAYDPRQVEPAQVPDSVFDLTDERWRGKVAYAPTNASFQAFVTGMRELVGEDETRRWLTAMKANGVRAYDNNVRVLEAVDRGEAAIGLINHYYWYEKVTELGEERVNARIQFLREDPGGLVNVAGVGVLAGSDKPEPARRFAEFLLSPGSQRYFSQETAEYPVIEGVPTRPGLPPLASLDPPDLDLSELASLQETLALLEEVGLS